MKMKFYLFSFLILAGLMSCQEEESFASEEDVKSSQDLLTRSGGDQEYESVVINGIRIMTKNLNVGTFVSTVGEANYWQFDDAGIQKWGYDDVENNCDTLGGLYEWWEMMTGGYTDKMTTAKAHNTVLSGDISTWDTLYGIKTIQVGDVWHVQGICPDGWHLPSREEWLTIVPNETAPPAELGLILSGRREYNGGSFQYADRFGFYWSSTPTRNYSAWYRRFSSGSNLSEYVDGARSTGHPVRCVKTVYDDQEYESVEINGIRIMTKNLNVGTFVSTVGEANYWLFDDAGIQKWGYDNIESNCDTHGGLYEWWEMMTGGYTDKITTANAQNTTLSGDISSWSTLYGIKTVQVGGVWHVQGICPDGWHLPSTAEWSTIAPNWAVPPAELGLTLDGYRSSNGSSFGNLGSYGYWWSSTEYSSRFAHDLYLNRDGSVLTVFDSKESGFSVRCVGN